MGWTTTRHCIPILVDNVTASCPPSRMDGESTAEMIGEKQNHSMGSALRALARIEAHVMHCVDYLELTVQDACETLIDSAELLRAHSLRAGKVYTDEGPAYPSAVLTGADIIRG